MEEMRRQLIVRWEYFETKLPPGQKVCVCARACVRVCVLVRACVRVWEWDDCREGPVVAACACSLRVGEEGLERTSARCRAACALPVCRRQGGMIRPCPRHHPSTHARTHTRAPVGCVAVPRSAGGAVPVPAPVAHPPLPPRTHAPPLARQALI